MPWIKVNSEPPKPTTFEDLGYVKVVRCKDCTYWKRRECGTYGYCERHDGFYDQEWFCADGERRE